MGIKNLTTLIKSKSPDSIETKGLYTFKDKTIAVDASILIYKSLTNVRSGQSYLTNKEGKIGIKWLQVEEDIYLTAKDQFYGVYGYGNDKDWNDGKMSWVFWYVCDEVENLINKLKQQASEQKG